MKDNLEQHSIGVDVDRFEFPRLEAGPLVWVKRQETKAGELDLSQWDLGEL